MTSIFYPDCSAVSTNSKWNATAVSPHNGSIPRQDGSSAEGAFAYKYREHQSEFRYRLESEDGSIIWERWQSPNEDSPHELVVADDGTVVVRTHGFSPELIAFGGDGEVTSRVALAISRTDVSVESNEAPGNRTCDNVVYVDSMSHSTAGNFWTHHSWRYYLNTPLGLLFVWRTCRGQRIVIDPVRGSLIPMSGAEYDGIADLLDTAEAQESLDLLKRICPKKERITQFLQSPDDVQLDPVTLGQVSRVSAAILLAGVAHNQDAISSLKDLEELDWPSFSTGTTGMPDHWIEVQCLRPLIQHALKLMNEVPAGFPCYYFTDGDHRYLVQSCIPQRADKLARLRSKMNATDILDTVGTPDHVHRSSVKSGGFYVWPERWEYDEFDGKNWFTTVLHWEEGTTSSLLVMIKREKASWTDSSGRLMAILG